MLQKKSVTRNGNMRGFRASRMRDSGLGALLLCLPLCCGCSLKPEILTQVRMERVFPPPALMRESPEPPLRGKNNEALLEWALDMRLALRRTNANLKALRAWAEGAEQ